MENDYNGFRNRSTWLARLHLENTSKEVLDMAQKFAQKDKELRADKSQWTGFSWPYHQLRANEKGAEDLLRLNTTFNTEADKSYKDILWPQVFDAINDNVGDETQFILCRDGQEIMRGTDWECVKYIHDHHSFSVDHALQHEGYSMTKVA